MVSRGVQAVLSVDAAATAALIQSPGKCSAAAPVPSLFVTSEINAAEDIGKGRDSGQSKKDGCCPLHP
jgi:hypothetical protein